MAECTDSEFVESDALKNVSNKLLTDLDNDGNADIQFTAEYDTDGKICSAISSRNIRLDIVTEQLIEKYQNRQGKQLFIRFPSKLPLDDDEFQEKVKKLSSLIIKAHKPRQKYARFCLVDFNTKDDRDAALKSIRSAVKQDGSLKDIFVALPRSENEHFVQQLVDKKLKTIETKKAKLRLKRASKKSVRLQNFTSSIVVLNLPKSASTAEIKKVFPNAVDIQVKPGSGGLNGASTATVTLPSTMEAWSALKQTISIGGYQLITRFESKNLTLFEKKLNRNRKLKEKKE